MTPEIWVAVAACLGSMIVVLINGGRQVGRVEAAISRLSGIEAKLEEIPQLKVKLGVMEAAYERTRSDHRQLASTVDRIRDRLPSVHDE